MTAPNVALNAPILVENTRIWRELGQGNMRAVIKSNGYGWGAPRLMQILEQEVDGFCVLDSHEFRAVRQATRRPLTILGFCVPDEIAELLEGGALPNIATLAELNAAMTFSDACAKQLTIRVGLSPALSWNGVAPEITDAFAERAAAARYLQLELWTHLTSPQAQASELQAFEAFTETFRRAGARIASIDIASSASLARGIPTLPGSPLRIGIGLFGAFKRDIPKLQCALQLSANVVARQASAPMMHAGYARATLPPGQFVETLRIGYGDGFPRGIAGKRIELAEGPATIVTIGMQHMIMCHDLPPAPTRTLLHPETDIEALCMNTTTSTHELVVGLGTSAVSH